MKWLSPLLIRNNCGNLGNPPLRSSTAVLLNGPMRYPSIPLFHANIPTSSVNGSICFNFRPMCINIFEYISRYLIFRVISFQSSKNVPFPVCAQWKWYSFQWIDRSMYETNYKRQIHNWNYSCGKHAITWI